MTASHGSEMTGTGQPKESFEASEATHEITASAERFIRKPNGRWTAEVRVDLIVKLPDGRELRENRLVSLGGIIQEGRRPMRRG
jgi:hypothetical protein